MANANIMKTKLDRAAKKTIKKVAITSLVLVAFGAAISYSAFSTASIMSTASSNVESHALKSTPAQLSQVQETTSADLSDQLNDKSKPKMVNTSAGVMIGSEKIEVTKTGLSTDKRIQVASADTSKPVSRGSETSRQLYGYSNLKIHNYIRYKGDANKQKVRDYLISKNSVLAEPTYFDAIWETGKEFGLAPELLFAITGSEQSFVVKGSKNYRKVANNPFNVYHSWYEYNTNIKDTSRIAARTVINLAKGCPSTSDVLVWINSRYAEDTNWSNKVRRFYTAMIE